MCLNLNLFVTSFQKVISLNDRVESAPVTTTRETDLKPKISILQVFIAFFFEDSYLNFIHLYTCILITKK